ncbi:MAG: isoprenylcysteine carboxylmethyltransferase family protein [Sphingomicrobium sp.]
MASEDNPRVFLPPPLIFGGLLALGLLLDSDPLRFGPVSIGGLVLAVGGVVLIGIAFGLFRASGTRAEPWQPSSSLVDRGLYRFTRNPMYLGMALLSLGIAIAFTSLTGVFLALAALLIIDRAVVTREEAYLKRRFGQDYVAYMARVRRWL